MEPMAVYPRDGIDVDTESIVHERQALHEPILVIERAVGDTHVNDARQIQPRKEPADDQTIYRRDHEADRHHAAHWRNSGQQQVIQYQFKRDMP